MEKLKIVIKKYWKIYLAALVISAVCDLIGTVKLNIWRWYTYSVSDGVCRHIRRAFRAGYF